MASPTVQRARVRDGSALGLIRALEILRNLVLREPRPFPLALGKQGRLIRVVRRARIVGLRIGDDAVCRGRRSELHGQNVTIAADGGEFAILFLLITHDPERTEIPEAPALEVGAVLGHVAGHWNVEIAATQTIDGSPGYGQGAIFFLDVLDR